MVSDVKNGAVHLEIVANATACRRTGVTHWLDLWFGRVRTFGGSTGMNIDFELAWHYTAPGQLARQWHGSSLPAVACS